MYRHAGNLSPEELARRGRPARVTAEDDAGPRLRHEAPQAGRDGGGSIWSYRRDMAHVRIVVFDSREGRVLEPVRKMTDDAEWRKVERDATGGGGPPLPGDTPPGPMGPAFHYAQAWDEAGRRER